MNDNNQAIDSAVKKASKHKVSGKRRTLVKAAMGAAPAVLTLRSGAAFALNSAEMCVPFDNAVASSTPPIVLTATDLNPYVREAVACRTLVNGGTSFKVYQHPLTSVWQDGEYAANTLATKFYINSGVDMVEDGTITPVYTVTTEPNCYVLVIMSDTGSIIGYGNAGPNGNGLPYITNSCWASATPAP